MERVGHSFCGGGWKTVRERLKATKKQSPPIYIDSIKRPSFEFWKYSFCGDIGSITTLGKWLKEKLFGLSWRAGFSVARIWHAWYYFLAHSKASCYKSVCSTQAGCVREAQSWEQVVKSMQETNKEAAWSKQVSSKRFRGGTLVIEGIKQ